MIGPFAPAQDASSARWVTSNLSDFGTGVGSIVPGCFERYARIFYPASRWVSDEREAGPGATSTRWVDGTMRWERPVRWSEVAAANGRVMHAAAEWGSLTGALHFDGRGQEGIWDSPPGEGGPPRFVAERLVAVLERFTGTPQDCWFGVSEIWGDSAWENLPEVPKFGSDARRYWLLKAPLRAAVISPHTNGEDQLADLWWPDDRAWFLGSDVDLVSSYLGGTDACIEAVLADEALEAFPVALEQGVSWDTDTINPLPSE